MKKNKIVVKSLLILVFSFFLGACSSDAPTDPNDPKFDDIGDDDMEVSINTDITLMVNATDGIDINPEIFGVNNDWRQIPDNTFSNFASTVNSIGTTVFRYPGGWESEFYAWSSNTTPGWDNTPSTPGASVSSLKSNITNYSIVLPTVDAMNTVMGSSQWNAALAKLKATAQTAITVSGIENGIVEIGNEWWLQHAGGVSRAQKLDKYVNVAMDLAEYINDEFPSREFKLLINGDYTQPQEFTTMKNKFTKAYNVIDGVALHTYTGYSTSTHNIADLEQRIIDCANNFNPNKNFTYLSEWMPSRDYNDRALYMEAANIIPDIIHIYARAGANAGAFWPPINTSIPGLGLTNWNYTKVFPTGQIFKELSESYKGKALKTTSNTFHLAAALNDSQTMVLFVTGGKELYKKAGIMVEGFNVNSIENVERYVPVDYSDTAKAEPYIIETASAQLSSDNKVVIDVNKEGKYQIYKIVLKGDKE
ncbi:hypothetical protein [Algibacter pectinivorans]|uniref:Alpha-L-arabinofuranosidase n=1 Tax=Algibacter pectinivorans TaxID=870482 RepID=A0A1I1QD86_9FLAO|nr:hypothetical protein [Algibacter pectinivorans]SFD17183.1 hypothetical protein SAMN04487987_105195 [Algibacter pectinivorans]